MPRRPRSSRFAAVAAGTALLATAATGCNAAAKNDDSAAAESGGKSFTLVTPDPVGQNEFLKLAVDGVKAAAKAHDGTQKVYQSSDTASQQQNVQAAVDTSPDVIVLVGFEFADVVAQQAEAHPEQQFLVIDACTTKTFKNVSCAVFREHEGVYLAGAEAGLLSRSGKVGAVDVLDTPQFRRYSDPFAAGAKEVAAKTSASTRFVGGQSPFDDSARAKEQANSLLAKGADQIMAAAAAGNYGVFEAAKAKGAYAYGVDVNQCTAAPGTVVDNVIKKTDVAVREGVEQVLAGKGGKTISYGLKEGGISLTGLEDGVESSKCVIAEHEDVLKKVEALRDRIVSGELTVDDPATK
ncbi:BMP family ABC transporter substrate-binding protein [Streptomyces phaeochromogenes]|uniref:BMP family ABC transporter substrate-binding protein n=1 Tax=Streptomyces phaeochromogenes TaxID=1923 RepID=A0ABZ1HK55_STRPH|nr:BMP family ABC transporter substrate-binding protein [Streptomyces phaeochromogenes]MCX5598069.1 BMP family ABC transporter substrate-binding protein [Streptomyces phaeochromogenes]WSD18990.1 BMP family ABC transporter substrate-binding protein [Streptomyces phaeochromogenes]WSJ04209.1 BMP family ABC transporter substrate-binding protein [Streptomyces phaeochromogenes]